MDKYEYKLKLDEMKSLTAEGHYNEAATIADTINWHKIKNVNSLIKAGEIYEKVGRYEESRDILLMAYDRTPIGRMIIYRLAEVAVKMSNFDEAKDYYQEFVDIAPHDNLKYVLKYEISKAEGADLGTLIGILEELKEQEYSEEWAYELAVLYHKAGMSEKCIDSCDELILWFGDGPYVERALELKMIYQPLTMQQEEKYRQFQQKKEGIIEVRPEEELASGEIVQDTVQIPKVQLSAERFNTQNLQEELKKSMKQIMEATEQETVDDSMDAIKKLVEEIPYLKMSKEEKSEEITEEPTSISGITDTVSDIADRDYRTPAADFEVSQTELLETPAEEYDGQMQLPVSEPEELEKQITGQMSIGDILEGWEKSEQEAKQRKLDSAKAKALKEAGDIMEQLTELIPILDSDIAPKDLLTQQYQEGEEIDDEKAAEVVANMNQLLQQEIERISMENARIDEKIARAGAKWPVEAANGDDVQIKEKEPANDGIEYLTEFPEEDVMEEDVTEEETEFPEKIEQNLIDRLLEEEAIAKTDGDQTDHPAGAEPDTHLEKESLTGNIGPEDFPDIEISLEESELSETSDVLTGEAKQIEADIKPLGEDMEEAILREALKTMSDEPAEKEEQLPEIEIPDEEGGFTPITKLSKEQRAIFTYFVPIKGMEQQLCQALTGTAGHLKNGKTASTGNMIIQGGRGSGKTVLATGVVKALQKEIGKPSGKVGKIEAAALNQRDAASLIRKVAGGCLIIEKAGDISKETAAKMAELLAADRSGLFVIIEDTHKGIEKALSRDAGFAARFSEKINIPIFTSDELVTFAKAYSNELGYTIDEMGVLALYKNISNIQKLDRATTLTEVKDIVDQAIDRSERGKLKKVFSIITSHRYDKEDYIILREKDFEF